VDSGAHAPESCDRPYLRLGFGEGDAQHGALGTLPEFDGSLRLVIDRSA
jgi:hypothetical protein